MWALGKLVRAYAFTYEPERSTGKYSLLIKVEQSGAANASCHNGYKSCFYRKLADLDAAAAGDYRLAFTADRLFDPATVYRKK